VTNVDRSTATNFVRAGRITSARVWTNDPGRCYRYMWRNDGAAVSQPVTRALDKMDVECLLLDVRQSDRPIGAGEVRVTLRDGVE
jgi:hypothetical protein